MNRTLTYRRPWHVYRRCEDIIPCQECCCALVRAISPNKPCQNQQMSLVKICIIVLVKNFDKYVLASTFELLTNKQIEFMKLVSDIFFSMLANLKAKLTLRQACFLINPHLTMLDLSCINSNDMDAVLDKLTITQNSELTCLTAVLELSFEQEITLINAMPSMLESLSLEKCSDIVVRKIVQKFPNLKELDLSCCSDVTDACIEILARGAGSGKNMVLQVLDVRETGVSTQGCIFALKNIPNLFVLYADKLADAIFSDSARYNLRALIGNLFYGIPYDFVACLRRLAISCPCLTTLVVHDPISEFQLLICAVLGKMQFLEVLALSCKPRCDVSWFFELAGPNLTKLSIDGTEINISLRLLLEYCPKLKFLHLMQVNVEYIESLVRGSFIMRSLVEIFFKEVSFTLNTAKINITPNSVLPEQLSFKRSCFVNFEDFIDKIISSTCASALIEHGVHYLHALPILAQILHEAAPNIEIISICGRLGEVPRIQRFYCNNLSQIS